MSAFDPIRQAYLGGGRLPARLTPESKRRLVLTSIAPGVIVTAALVYGVLSIAYDFVELYGGPDEVSSYLAPLVWRRLWGVSNELLSLTPLAVALLFAAGIQHWNRNDGFWMLVVGTGIAGTVLVLGAFAVASSVVLDQFDTAREVRADVWLRLAGSLGYLAVGYFFLAYRGATSAAAGNNQQASAEQTRETE